MLRVFASGNRLDGTDFFTPFNKLHFYGDPTRMRVFKENSSLGSFLPHLPLRRSGIIFIPYYWFISSIHRKKMVLFLKFHFNQLESIIFHCYIYFRLSG